MALAASATNLPNLTDLILFRELWVSTANARSAICGVYTFHDSTHVMYRDMVLVVHDNKAYRLPPPNIMALSELADN